MKHQVLTLALIGAAAARPAAFLKKREVPQEQSHKNILDVVNTNLKLDNPNEIVDAVFGLLGAAAGIKGAGKIQDADCLQLATADQAFTNAKAAGDVDGQTAALIYRALERNTGSVGLASVPCQSIKAVNPEIAALEQHQDPAGDGAQDLNKQIASTLAQQIAAVGGDPLLANEAGTFQPGQVGDPTGAGNTCDDENDAAGCINSQGLRVDDLSEAEIKTAAAGQGNLGAGASFASAGGAAGNASAQAGGNANANKGGAAQGAAAGNNAAAGNDSNAQDAQGNASKDAGKAQGAGQAASGQAASSQAASGQAAAGAASGASAFGACDPTIKFGTPSDGRKEDAFEPTDLATFNHGSALNINVISQFICSQLSNKCQVAEAAVTTCDDAAKAADGLKAQAAADAFNNALGL